MKTKLLFSIFLGLLFFSQAQVKYLDSNFNTVGFSVTDYRSDSYDSFFKLKINNTKDAIFTFSSLSLSNFTFYESGFSVLKHNLTNGLNSNFGVAGKSHYYADSYHSIFNPNDIYEYSDGSFLILGMSETLRMAKIDKSGNPDPAFGFNGQQVSETAASNKILMLPDGKFYTFGRKADNLCIEKFTANGFADFSFGNQGELVYDLGTNEEIVDAELLNDGKILLIANSIENANSTPNYNYRRNILRKMNPDGSLDPSFSYNQGTSFLNTGIFRKAELSADNTYVYVLNKVETCVDNILKINLLTQSLELIIKDNRSHSFFACSDGDDFDIEDIILAGEKIFVAGNAGQNIFVYQFNTDGTLDSSFADQGKFIYSPGKSSDEKELEDIELADDGGIYGGATLNRDILVFKILKNFYLSSDEIRENKNVILLYPNPVANNANLLISSKSSKNISIQIFDFSGKLVKSFAKKITSGENKVELDLANLPTGNYVVNCSSGDFSQSIHMIKK